MRESRWRSATSRSFQNVNASVVPSLERNKSPSKPSVARNHRIISCAMIVAFPVGWSEVLTRVRLTYTPILPFPATPSRRADESKSSALAVPSTRDDSLIPPGRERSEDGNDRERPDHCKPDVVAGRDSEEQGAGGVDHGRERV